MIKLIHFMRLVSFYTLRQWHKNGLSRMKNHAVPFISRHFTSTPFIRFAEFPLPNSVFVVFSVTIVAVIYCFHVLSILFGSQQCQSGIKPQVKTTRLTRLLIFLCNFG